MTVEPGAQTGGQTGGPAGGADLACVLAGFGVAGGPAHVEVITAGHIHGTWAVTVGGRRYVAQSVNRAVFVDLDACESNLSRLDRHLQGRAAVTIPRLHRTAAGAVHWIDAAGGAWRLADFAEGTVGGTVATDAGQAYDAASAFGRYVAALDTIDGGPLLATIDRFHDLAWRRTQLRSAVADDERGRRPGCADDILAVDRVAAQVAAALDEVTRRYGLLPMRIVHNDAKVANVRFDAVTGRAAMIVDLDTTMPGSVVFDVGELLRTATVTAAEDAGAVGAVGVDPERVTAVVRGMLDGLGTSGPPAAGERAAFAWAGPLMAIENAVRFLTDHLRGDVYFGAARAGQNLDRARTQAALALALMAHADVVAATARSSRGAEGA